MPISVTIIEGELKYLEYLKILLSHSRDLACAEGLNVDYFITCDDKIIKKVIPNDGTITTTSM